MSRPTVLIACTSGHVYDEAARILRDGGFDVKGHAWDGVDLVKQATGGVDLVVVALGLPRSEALRLLGSTKKVALAGLRTLLDDCRAALAL